MSKKAHERRIAHMATVLSGPNGPQASTARLILPEVLDLLTICGISVDVCSLRQNIWLYAPVEGGPGDKADTSGFAHFDGSVDETFNVAGGICQLAWFVVQNEPNNGFGDMSPDEKLAAERAVQILRETVAALLPEADKD